MSDDSNEKPPSKSDPKSLPTQEEIAQRVAALMGPEDEADRVAADEEVKLAERRGSQPSRSESKGALAEAASKRLAKIGTKKPLRQSTAAAAADPVLRTTANLGAWMQKNTRYVVLGVVGAVAAVAALIAYNASQKSKETNASAAYTQGVDAERGHVGSPEKEKDDSRPSDGLPTFKTAQERREASLAKYRDVQARFPRTGASVLARLGEASLLLDQHEADAALAAYNDVRSSALATVDAEVRGRALEGIGFALELKADQVANKTPETFDDAIKAYRELENTDVKGFKELGMYHQARCFELKGDKTQAVEFLKNVRERVRGAGEGHPFPYLEEMVDGRLRTLDPTAIPATPMGGGRGGSGGGGANSMTEAQIQELIAKLKSQAPPAGHPPEGPTAPPPPPAPEGK